jgi:drug/metabolite transporter (DMT)-like permease
MAFPKPAGNVRAMNALLLALVPACFAMNPVIGRAMAGVFGPASLSVTRWALSGIIIAAVALSRGGRERWRVPAGMYVRLMALGALGMGFCAYAAFEGARTTTATNIGLIYACTAALVAAWEIAAGRQRLTAALLAGIVACLAGVVAILTRGHPELLLNLKFTPGDLWAAAGTVVFAVYTVAMRRVASILTPLPQFAAMSIGATLALMPISISEVAARGIPVISAETLPWLAALVLVAGIGAFLGYNLSLARNGPVLTSASISLTPVYAAGLAIALIGEQLAWYHAAALVLVVGGLLLINRGQMRRQ